MAALYRQGDYAAIIRTLEGLFAADPNLPHPAFSDHENALLLLIRACANRGELEKAAQWCQEAITAYKLNPVFHYLQATIFQEQGEIEKAMQALKRARFLDPNFVLVHFALGTLARQQGQLAEANRHFANALSLLRAMPPDAIVPESEGLTAQKLADIITLLLPSNASSRLDKTNKN